MLNRFKEPDIYHTHYVVVHNLTWVSDPSGVHTMCRYPYYQFGGYSSFDVKIMIYDCNKKLNYISS